MFYSNFWIFTYFLQCKESKNYVLLFYWPRDSNSVCESWSLYLLFQVLCVFFPHVLLCGHKQHFDWRGYFCHFWQYFKIVKTESAGGSSSDCSQNYFFTSSPQVTGTQVSHGLQWSFPKLFAQHASVILSFGGKTFEAEQKNKELMITKFSVITTLKRLTSVNDTKCVLNYFFVVTTRFNVVHY